MRDVTRKLVERRDNYEIWDETSLVEISVGVLDDAGDPEGTQEVVGVLEDMSGRLVTVTVGRTSEGAYIGDLKTTTFLCEEKGIAPEPMNGGSVCSIGFCEREQKWYGWSHRAIYGFGVGDVVSEGDCTASSGYTDDYLKDHPEADTSLPVGFRAETLDDAKRMAEAFAESVS